jgi:hypothetical protein
MDLDIDGVRIARERADLALRPGERLLAGGTFLYSEPVPPGVTGLVDLLGLDWEPWIVPDGGPGRGRSERGAPGRLESASGGPGRGFLSGGSGSGGLEVAATCTIATLRDRAAESAGRYPGLRLVAPCVSAFLLSFKVAHTATVGGNLCLGLPAGPMAALFATLDATAEIWTPGGGTRVALVADLITGPGTTTLAADEVLRAVHVPPVSLGARTASRKLSLTDFGRSAVLVTGATLSTGEAEFGAGRSGAGATGAGLTGGGLSGVVSTGRPLGPDTPGAANAVRIVVTASVPRPVVLPIPAGDHDALDRAVDGITDWYDDPHGAPDWRAAMTRRLTHEVLEELS